MAFFGRRASGEYKEVLVDAEGHILTQEPVMLGEATADGAANGTTLISLLNLTAAEGLGEPNDFWNESWLAILTGDMADQRRRVTDWVLATGTLTVDPAFFNPLVSLLTVDAPLADVVIDVADASVFRAGSLLTADSPFGDLVIEVANARIFRPGNAFIWDTVTPAGEVVVITDVDKTLNQLTIAAPGIVFAGGYLIANTASISMVNNALIWDDATPAGEPVTIIARDTTLNQLTLAPPGIALAAGYTVGANAAISMSRMITDGTHFRLEAVAKTEDTGVHSNIRRYEKDYGFTSNPIARVGAAATPLWADGLAAVYPAAGRTAGLITTIYEFHIENSTGAAVTAWLEVGGNAITVPYHVATLDTAVIEWPAGFDVGNVDININASVNDVIGQIFGTQE